MRPLPVLNRSATVERLPPMPAGFAPATHPLVDANGRRYTYLRLSVTDRCDLACRYCMPPGGEDDHALRPELLSFEEAARVIGVFAGGGIRRVRFTGGEPLVRKDFVHMVDLVQRRTGVEDMVLTTNATRLAELAGALRAAGIGGVNVSIDSLDPDRFRDITRGGDLRRVLAGIHAALEAGLRVKTNTVLLGGVNDDELGRLVDWAWGLGITPRFIELMPLGEGAQLPASHQRDAAHAIATLGDRLGADQGATADAGHGPARYRTSRDGKHRVGFITAMSASFCDDCNRVRVTARGDIRACLASRRAISLRDLVRNGATDESLYWALYWALIGKGDGHRFTDPTTVEHQHVGMSLVGG